MTRPRRMEYGVQSIAISEKNPAVMVAIGNDPVQGQTLRSTDFGKTWRVVAREKRSEWRLHIHQASDSLLFAEDRWSEDGGETWVSESGPRRHGDLGCFGNPTDYAPLVRVTSHAANDSTIWYCAEPGLGKITYWKSDRQIHKRTEIKASAKDYGTCHDVLIFPDNPSHFWMGTDYGLWESRDGGDTWTKLDHIIGPVAVTSIYLTPDEEEIAITTWGRGMWSVRTEDVAVLPTSTEDVEELPGEPYVLHPNYPNPFTDETTLPFSIHGTGDVRLEIYDLLGRSVDVLTDQTYSAGTHRVPWNASGQASGVYFARMSVDGKAVSVQKVVRR